MVRRFLRGIAIATSATTLSACAVLQPYKHGDEGAFRANPSLANAVEFAENTRDHYEKAIDQNTLVNRTTGVLLIGAGTAATFLGIRGGRTGQITALGVSGAGLFGVNSLLYDRPRLGVYVAGMRAIGCSLGAFAPARARLAPGFEQSYSANITQRNVVVSLLESAPGNRTDVTQQARRAVKESDRVISLARQTIEQGRLAGLRLYENVQQIHANVSAALLASEPDLSALVNSLATVLPQRAQAITGVEINPESQDDRTDGGRRQSIDDTKEANVEAEKLMKETKKLERLNDAFFRAQSSLEELVPAAADLTACADFAAPLPFRVLPAPTLELTTGTTAGVLVSGGRPPYRAAWVGTVPANLPITEEAAGSRVSFKIDGAKAKVGGPYKLILDDSSGQTATVLVTVQKAPSS